MFGEGERKEESTSWLLVSGSVTVRWQHAPAPTIRPVSLANSPAARGNVPRPDILTWAPHWQIAGVFTSCYTVCLLDVWSEGVEGETNRSAVRGGGFFWSRSLWVAEHYKEGELAIDRTMGIFEVHFTQWACQICEARQQCNVAFMYLWGNLPTNHTNMSNCLQVRIYPWFHCYHVDIFIYLILTYIKCKTNKQTKKGNSCRHLFTCSSQLHEFSPGVSNSYHSLKTIRLIDASQLTSGTSASVHS